MNIKLIGTKVTQDTQTFAFQKNNLVDNITVEVDTEESWQYKLDIQYTSKGDSGETLYNIINLTRSGNLCMALLTATMLPFDGRYIMQLRGTNGTQIYHSEIFEGWVERSLDPSSTYDPVPSEFYQVEGDIDELNTHPPYPHISGFWMVWNLKTHEYELSDIPVPTVSGVDKTYVHTQNIAASTWVIKHDLYKYPSVSVVDSAENQVVGEVAYDSLNSLTITFAAPFSGRAYLN